MKRLFRALSRQIETAKDEIAAKDAAIVAEHAAVQVRAALVDRVSGPYYCNCSDWSARRMRFEMMSPGCKSRFNLVALSLIIRNWR